MNTLNDILKASIWGVLLLVLLACISGAATIAVVNITDRFYTSSKVAEYKKTNAVINKALVNLEHYMSENERKADWSADSDENVTILKDFIEKGIAANCHTGCYELDYRTPTYGTPKDSYEVRNYREKLERLIDNNEISDANRTVAFSFVMSLLTFLFSMYLIVALFRYKKLTAKGLTVLVLLISPFLLASGCFATTHVGEYMEFKIENGIVITIVACAVYLFIVFPPVIFISKKRGYSISKIIKLDGLN